MLPRDNRLEISIYDKVGGLLSFGDTLIGQTVIDLEKRRFGNVPNQAKMILDKIKEGEKEFMTAAEKETY